MNSNNPKEVVLPDSGAPAGPIDMTRDYVSESNAAELVRVLDQYIEDLKAGTAPSHEELVARHPALAQQLAACLAGLQFIHGVEHALPGRFQSLGDFRIVREVGRGGMGAVFEAEQISLGRRVALKVLRFGGVSDPEALERFQREAETVAKLHHTNIVPIFAIGNEQGVNYYAMQFIDGQNLGEVLASRDKPLPAAQVAEWGLQAAEALVHAHQRGVIHRDVKPSNLLLDSENRIWLTDFGLARRLDDLTLSMTGALLGTPRYMSPEQAAASAKRIDHRSDIFSLGATLYELLAGIPAFSGENPHDVIQRIIKDEPIALCALAPAIPRDLETIVMKCLAKDPQYRYKTARDLADDLRAFLDGRPIQARRASALELASRWFSQHRRSMAMVTVAIACTLLLVLAIGLGKEQYAAWQRATLRLGAVKQPLIAEFFDSNSRLVRTETLPMQADIQLPADNYRLRVSGQGHLSQTYSLLLERGESSHFEVSLEDRYWFTSQPLERGFDVMDLGDEAGIVLWTERGVSLRKKNHLPLEWSVSFGPDIEVLQAAPGFELPWSKRSNQVPSHYSNNESPWVVSSYIDVNSDGVGDLIAAGRHQAWVIALSGADGKTLWLAARSKEIQQASGSTSSEPAAYQSKILGEPIVGPDLDGDGVSELLASIISVVPNPLFDETRQDNIYLPSRCIEAISGRTGEVVWHYDLAEELFSIQSGEKIAAGLRWSAYGLASTHVDSPTFAGGAGKLYKRKRQRTESYGAYIHASTAAVSIRLSGNEYLACLAGRYLIIIDPNTGRELEPPIDLGIRGGVASRWEDVDRDGSSDLLLVEEIPATNAFEASGARLHLWSHATRTTVWSLTLDSYCPGKLGWDGDTPAWPIVTDLQEDGKFEILVPHGTSSEEEYFSTRGQRTTPWGKLVALEAITGQEIWNHKIVSMDAQIDTFMDGPDLDHDGVKEIYAVSLVGNACTIFVDALSGRDGKTLWTSSFTPRDLKFAEEYSLGTACWWYCGQDGWPQLIVPLMSDTENKSRSVFCIFSAGTGEVSHYGYGFTSLEPADLDSDGVEELLLSSRDSFERNNLGGELKCLRGVGYKPWMQLGDPRTPTEDLDGDGVRDLIHKPENSLIHATSGATGLPLWHSRVPVDSRGDEIVNVHQPIAGRDELWSGANRGVIQDFDLDGCADLLVWVDQNSLVRSPCSPLYAISGRTGKFLWELSSRSVNCRSTLALKCVDLDGDGTQEVVWLAIVESKPTSSAPARMPEAKLSIFAVSGQSGEVIWSEDLSVQAPTPSGQSTPTLFSNIQPYKKNQLEIVCGDLNQDGHKDLLVPAIQISGGLELWALSGVDGHQIWSYDCHHKLSEIDPFGTWITPTLYDASGDGKLEVAFIGGTPSKSAGSQDFWSLRLSSLIGGTGKEFASHDIPLNYSLPYMPDALRNLLQPVGVRVGPSKQCLAIYLPGLRDIDEAKILVFDAGRICFEREIQHHSLESGGLVAFDQQGDGVDELMFFEGSVLHAVSVEPQGQAIWSRDFEAQDPPIFLSLRYREGKLSPEIIVRTLSPDNNIIGVDSETGNILWSCPGLDLHNLDGDNVKLLDRPIVLGELESGLPLIYFAFKEHSECRQAVSKRGSVEFSTNSLKFTDRLTAVPVELGRSIRDTRWTREPQVIVELSHLARLSSSMLPWSALFSITMILLPLGYIGFVTTRRQFGLLVWLGFPVVIAFVILSIVIPIPDRLEFGSPLSRWLVGMCFAPPIASLFLILFWWATGNYRLATKWIGISLLFSMLLVPILFLLTFLEGTLQPEERVDGSGWYIILGAGAYISSWALVVVHGVTWALDLIGRKHLLHPKVLG